MGYIYYYLELFAASFKTNCKQFFSDQRHEKPLSLQSNKTIMLVFYFSKRNMVIDTALQRRVISIICYFWVKFCRKDT